MNLTKSDPKIKILTSGKIKNEEIILLKISVHMHLDYTKNSVTKTKTF